MSLASIVEWRGLTFRFGAFNEGEPHYYQASLNKEGLDLIFSLTKLIDDLDFEAWQATCTLNGGNIATKHGLTSSLALDAALKAAALSAENAAAKARVLLEAP